MRAELAARAGAARFALYYAPPRASAWWRAGCAWLGRDPEDGATLAPPQPGALRRPVDALTVAPRRWRSTSTSPHSARSSRCGPRTRTATTHCARSPPARYARSRRCAARPPMPSAPSAPPRRSASASAPCSPNGVIRTCSTNTGFT
ncbi:phosphonate metabolism protein [Burkholderia pseudomallei Pakistan 9]|nr:phosphonate metabolism protein [Burkholderia pseudomallei Pakistan 9]